MSTISAAEAFQKGSFNKQMGLWVHDWYALGSIFSSSPVVCDDQLLVGVRQLVVQDVASQFLMHFYCVPSNASTTEAADIIRVFEEAFVKYQMPSKGVVVSSSVWYSSDQLISDPETTPRGEVLKAFDLHFPAMTEEARNELRVWARNRGIRCAFSENEMS